MAAMALPPPPPLLLLSLRHLPPPPFTPLGSGLRARCWCA